MQTTEYRVYRRLDDGETRLEGVFYEWGRAVGFKARIERDNPDVTLSLETETFDHAPGPVGAV